MEMKRAIHLDFHTMPGIEDFGAGYTAESLAKQLKEANVNYINMFARCNLGFSYYPTKVGTPYPTMKGDLLGDVIRECHKVGIGVTAYFNCGLNHQLNIDDPGTMRVNKDGTVYTGDRVFNNFFRTPCMNSSYRQHLLSEVAEVVEKQPDGIFCDTLLPRPCYCPRCTKLMHERGIDMTDDAAVVGFAADTLREMFDEIRAIVPRSMRLIINGFPYEGISHLLSHGELEYLPTDIWGYDYLAAQAPYYRMMSDELVYMTGRFVSGWGDFGGNKSDASLENDVYDALLYGFAPSVGDHMHPSRGLDKNLYNVIGKAYGFVKTMEQWTDRAKTPVVEAAILRNKLTNKNVLDHVNVADKGAARMLCELKIPYNVVNEDMDLSSYKLLILPDHIDITDQLAAKLEAFDGAILSSGSSMRQGSVWDYIDAFEPDGNDIGFYTWHGTTYGQYSNNLKLKSAYGISDYVEPYFQQVFDGLHGYFYVPPKEKSDYCAIAKKGNRVHIGFNVFEAYLQNGVIFHKAMIKELLEELLPERTFITDLPSTARISLMTGENTVMHIKTTYPELRGTLGIIEEHVSTPAGLTVSVKGAYSKVSLLPSLDTVESKVEQGRTVITLPRIDGYQAFLLEE